MKESIVLFPGEDRKVSATNTTTTFKVISEATGGKFSVAVYDLPSGFPGPPPHVHREFEHVWYVLSGALQVQIGDDGIEAPTGTSIFIPKDTPHTFGNPGPDECQVLAIDTPGGLEPYYEELSAAFPPGAPINPQVIADIQRRYDTYPK